MAAGRTELVGDVGAENPRLDGGALGLQRASDQPRVRLRVLPERDHARDSGVLRRALEAGKLRIVTIYPRGAARLEPGEEFGLGVRDRLDRGEEFEMHRLDRGD